MYKPYPEVFGVVTTSTTLVVVNGFAVKPLDVLCSDVGSRLPKNAGNHPRNYTVIAVKNSITKLPSS